MAIQPPRRPPPIVEPFVDDTIKLLGYEAIELLGYEAVRLYGPMAAILNLVPTPFTADTTFMT